MYLDSENIDLFNNDYTIKIGDFIHVTEQGDLY